MRQPEFQAKLAAANRESKRQQYCLWMLLLCVCTVVLLCLTLLWRTHTRHPRVLKATTKRVSKPKDGAAKPKK